MLIWWHKNPAGRIWWLTIFMGRYGTYYIEWGLCRHSHPARPHAVVIIKAQRMKPGCATKPKALRLKLSLGKSEHLAFNSGRYCFLSRTKGLLLTDLWFLGKFYLSFVQRRLEDHEIPSKRMCVALGGWLMDEWVLFLVLPCLNPSHCGRVRRSDFANPHVLWLFWLFSLTLLL
jgi:hypothetical protein